MSYAWTQTRDLCRAFPMHSAMLLLPQLDPSAYSQVCLMASSALRLQNYDNKTNNESQQIQIHTRTTRNNITTTIQN